MNVENPAVFILLTTLLAILASQALKVLFHLLARREVDWSYLISPSGLPSSHAAAVPLLLP